MLCFIYVISKYSCQLIKINYKILYFFQLHYMVCLISYPRGARVISESKHTRIISYE